MRKIERRSHDVGLSPSRACHQESCSLWLFLYRKCVHLDKMKCGPHNVSSHPNSWFLPLSSGCPVDFHDFCFLNFIYSRRILAESYMKSIFISPSPLSSSKKVSEFPSHISVIYFFQYVKLSLGFFFVAWYFTSFRKMAFFVFVRYFSYRLFFFIESFQGSLFGEASLRTTFLSLSRINFWNPVSPSHSLT